MGSLTLVQPSSKIKTVARHKQLLVPLKEPEIWPRFFKINNLKALVGACGK